MEALAVARAEEVIEVTKSNNAPPDWEEELYLLALEVWQHGSFEEATTEEWLEVEPWCHVSCL